MLGLCTAAFLYQAGLQVERYLEYAHISVTTEVKRQALVFPSVTMCSNSWVNKKSEACLKTPRLCTKFGQLRSLYTLPLLLPSPTELRIRLRFIEKNTLRLMSVLPSPVFVQAPRLCQPERTAAFALVAQQSYDIAIKQQMKRRLPSPYSSQCKDYNSEGVRSEFYGIPSKESCTQTCLMKKEMELCSCHLSDHEYSPMFNGRICNVVEGNYEREAVTVQENRRYGPKERSAAAGKVKGLTKFRAAKRTVLPSLETAMKAAADSQIRRIVPP
ncbi:uncharacterized protein LOC144094474 [Amblyomma americanum]